MVRNYLLLCLSVISIYFATNTVARESILGATKAEVDQFPYEVSLKVLARKCGGGIIGQQFILTAAHCFIDRKGEFRNDRTVALVGTNDRKITKSPAMRVTVEKVYVPTEFRIKKANAFGDIAVLKLKHPLKWSKHIQKLELPSDKFQTYQGQTAMIAGFGWISVKLINDTRQSGDLKNTHLRYAEAVVASPSEDCYPENRDNKRHICARIKQDYHKIRGVCAGDSGSPLVIDEKIVIGILSKGPHNCSEETRPATYTRVTYYLDFIDDAMQDKRGENIRVFQLNNKNFTEET